MKPTMIKERRQDIINKYGPWSGHNIHLGNDIYTMGKGISSQTERMRRFLQVICDYRKKDIEELRILDLACLEGLYAIELAMHGASTVGIEIREANLEKARFAQEVLGLKNVTFHQDDVRNLSKEKYGSFDVVICAGILYHLDMPDVASMLEKISSVCNHFAIIDTHVALTPRITRSYNGQEYHGVLYHEHTDSEQDTVKEEKLWASIDNPKSFWPTKAALCNMLADAGFTSVTECLNPREDTVLLDRVMLVAAKGEPVRSLTYPDLPSLPKRWAKHEPILLQFGYTKMRRFLVRVLPPKVRREMSKYLRKPNKAAM